MLVFFYGDLSRGVKNVFQTMIWQPIVEQTIPEKKERFLQIFRFIYDNTILFMALRKTNSFEITIIPFLLKKNIFVLFVRETINLFKK